MKKTLIFVFAILLLIVSCASEKKEPETIEEKFAYSIGGMIYEYYGPYYEINEKNVDFFVRGFKDKLSGNYLYDKETDARIFSEYSDIVLNKVSKENLEKAEAFLKENAGKEGVRTTSSGLQYTVIKEGNGKAVTKQSSVTTYYTLSDIEGNVIEQTPENAQGAATFNVSQLIPGITEGLCLMKEGSRYKFFVHPDLAYGTNGSGQIEPNQMLIFEFEIVSVNN